MSSSNDKAVFGVVEEVLPNSLYRVKLKSGAFDREVIAYLAGKLKLNHVRVVIGDEVEVVLDPHGGKATNRIVWRR